MKSAIEKIVTITSKGQITLPIRWRERLNARQVLISEKDNAIEIRPVTVTNSNNAEYTVFDAIRDNKGKGIKAKDLVKILQQLD